MQATRGTRERRIGVPGFAIASLVLLALAVGSLAPAVGTALDLQHRIAATKASVAAQQAQLRGLDAQLKQQADPAYLRSEAGSRLLFVVPGETTYRVVGTVPQASTPAAAPAVDRGWAASLYASIVDAGR